MKAFIFSPNKSSNYKYVIATEGKGGSIISDENLEKAKEKYIKSMMLFDIACVFEKFKKTNILEIQKTEHEFIYI